MVKVLDPTSGVIMGVWESRADVPERVPNRLCSYYFPADECEIEEVTDPKERERLKDCVNQSGKDYR